MRVFDALSGIFPRAGGVLFLLTALATTGWSQVETDEQGEVLAPNMASVFVGLTADQRDRLWRRMHKVIGPIAIG